VYRISRAVFSASKENVGWLMSLHQLSFLGLAAVFPVVLCVAVLVMAGSGLSMVQWSNIKGAALLSGNARASHRAIAPLALLPLVVTAASGGLFVVCTKWLGYSRQSVHVLLDIHQGSWVMPPELYVFIVGTLSLGVLLSGARLHPYVQRLCGTSSTTPQAERKRF